ncbi:polyphosphate kinase 2 family protein [Paeniglutamicibacter sp. ABSL32-1]|uniref:PPK2 family polyphosphate kinase n=1 Tax=Paeniglutamicibacter quisquiliarum TaxID=2849498 RepID=UPI001C2D81C5|nr:PPK2 family polyphosphate kinase [Paeniglutamicibacter quisquiliarum]MBV1779527.1 polyphosphate kinase 2 family protein [Paeniglutamicibacter quisquiliarum]
MSKKQKSKSRPVPFADAVGPALAASADFELAGVDPSSTPGYTGDKAGGARDLAVVGRELGELQERFYAASRAGAPAKVLLVLQAMDTAGKGGIVRHVIGAVDPQGVQLSAFKAPTAAEAKRDFLWRINRALPKAGFIGVFDRSHYEDVLIHKVRGLSPAEEIERRYGAIREFEAGLADKDTTVVKVMLHISKDEQRARLAERLEREDKHWKFNPADIDEREVWDEYMEAYQTAIRRTHTQDAPWFVVPADRKWYARLAVATLLAQALKGIDPQWPAADFDVEEEKRRLAAS